MVETLSEAGQRLIFKEYVFRELLLIIGDGRGDERFLNRSSSLCVAFSIFVNSDGLMFTGAYARSATQTFVWVGYKCLLLAIFANRKNFRRTKVNADAVTSTLGFVYCHNIDHVQSLLSSRITGYKVRVNTVRRVLVVPTLSVHLQLIHERLTRRRLA